MGNNYATLESQIGNEPCTVEDTEEIFWLKLSDDYQSKVKSGDLLVRQYRFREGISEYLKAIDIKQNDPMLYLKLGGAYLTLFCFSDAEVYYQKAIELGAKEGDVAFYLGIKCFLQKNYSDALRCFEKTDVCQGEMLISAIYWHTITSFRMGISPDFLGNYNESIDAGHHKAYQTAVSVFNGCLEYSCIELPDSSLDAVILLYGISEYLNSVGQTAESELYKDKILNYTDVWPCIAYLAAYSDKKYNKLSQKDGQMQKNKV